MRSVSIRYEIQPLSWKRARRNNNRYFKTNEEYAYKEFIQTITHAQIKGEKLRGAIKMQLCFYLPRPKSINRKLPFVRPDIDNFTKNILDALNDVLYKDDAQIVSLEAHKRYAPLGEPGLVKLEAWEIDEA